MSGISGGINRGFGQFHIFLRISGPIPLAGLIPPGDPLSDMSKRIHHSLPKLLEKLYHAHIPRVNQKKNKCLLYLKSIK